MSQDIVSDALNQIMNAKRSKKKELTITHHSKLLASVLAIAKLNGYIKDFHVEGSKLKVTIGKLNGCNAIKPRYTVGVEQIDRYVQRYLPAKGIGLIVVSTSEGLMTHSTAQEKNIGGSLIAFWF